MGLKSTFAAAAKTGVAAFGDVAVSTVYSSFISTTVNVSTGAATTTYVSTAGVKVIFEDFTLEQRDTLGFTAEHKRALVPANNISGTTPVENDQIREDTTIWNVQEVRTDPAEALWDLVVRKA